MDALVKKIRTMGIKMDLYRSIVNSFYIENAYQEWKDYREHLTDLLIKAYEKCETSAASSEKKLKLLIAGGGLCNDMDIERLKEKYSITVMDIDENGKKYFNDKKYVNYILQTFTGIGENEYREFLNKMLIIAGNVKGRISFEELDINAYDFIKGMEDRISINNDIPRCDVLICAGVHSQLFSMFPYIFEIIIENLYNAGLLDNGSKSLEDLYLSSKFMEKVKRLNQKFIPEFNKSLIAAANNLCLFSFESGGVEGAIEGRIDLEENYKEKIIIKDSYDWNFNLKENKIYHMDIYLLQK